MDKKKIGAIIGVVGVASAIGATQLVDINRTAADNIHEKLAGQYEESVSSSLPETAKAESSSLEEFPEEEKPKAESLEEREIVEVTRTPEYIVGKFDKEKASERDGQKADLNSEEENPKEAVDVEESENKIESESKEETPDITIDKPEIAFQGKVTADSLNMRSKADVKSQSLGTLQKDDLVIGKLKNGWVSFEVEERTAYVDASYLQVLTDQELEEHKALLKKRTEEAIKAAEEAAKKAEEERQAQEKAKKEAEEKERIQKEQEEREASEAAKKAEEERVAKAKAEKEKKDREEAEKKAKEGKKEVSSISGYVKYEQINVRADSDRNSRIIGSLYLNDRVEGKVLKNKWIKIKYNGKDAYISNGILTDKKIKVKVEEKKVKGYVRSLEGLNVRSGPGEGFSQLGILSVNDYVEGIESEGWIKINFNGRVGYVIKHGISSQKQKVNTPNPGRNDNNSDEKPEEETSNGNRSLVDIAMSKIGTPYYYGGTGSPGFDCSGFVQYVYRQIGIRLPHKASSQATYGYDVEKENLRVGDLVFFSNTYSPDNITHVGIYIGGNRIIHASTGTRSVTIDYLTSKGYFTNNYVGARRILN